jgi:hypothetical protein
MDVGHASAPIALWCCWYGSASANDSLDTHIKIRIVEAAGNSRAQETGRLSDAARGHRRRKEDASTDRGRRCSSASEVLSTSSAEEHADISSRVAALRAEGRYLLLEWRGVDHDRWRRREVARTSTHRDQRGRCRDARCCRAMCERSCSRRGSDSFTRRKSLGTVSWWRLERLELDHRWRTAGNDDAGRVEHWHWCRRRRVEDGDGDGVDDELLVDRLECWSSWRRRRRR